MRKMYLSHRQKTKAQTSLRIRVVSVEPSLLAPVIYGTRVRTRSLTFRVAAHVRWKDIKSHDAKVPFLIRRHGILESSNPKAGSHEEIFIFFFQIPINVFVNEYIYIIVTCICNFYNRMLYTGQLFDIYINISDEKKKKKKKKNG